MEIAYLVHLNMGPESGVFQKISQQCACWEALGVKGRLYVLTRDQEVRAAIEAKSVCIAYKRGSWIDRFRKLRSVVERIIEAAPDVVYQRQDHYYPIIKRLSREVPIILEINTDVGRELRLYSKSQWIYQMLTRKKLWQAASGAAFVTHELMKAHGKIMRGRPAIVIANGIDLRGISTSEAAPNGRPPTLIFMGSVVAPWNGVDKILKMAGHFADWHFHLIGTEDLDVSRIPPNIHHHGVLEQSEFDPLLRSSDVAISTLALHRKGLDEASPLKTRQYLAYGLPVIVGYKDTDFPEDPDFLLRIENREDNVERNLDRIRDFVLRWKGKRVTRDRIQRIDMLEKERKRIEFFRFVAKRR